MGEKVAIQEVKNTTGQGIEGQFIKKPDGSVPNPYLQKTNLNNMYQGKFQATMLPNKQD